MSPGPSTEIDPIKVADEGGLGVHVARRGEFLVWSDSKLQLQPRLAESWKPNADGSVWTFKIRQGVKFHDGTPMTAEDVAASINALVRPEERLERAVDVRRRAVEGLGEGDRREHGGVRARRAERQLPVPAVSSDNYNAIIVPKDFERRRGRRRSRAPARGRSRSTRRTRASPTSRTRTTGTRRGSRSSTASRSSSTPRSRPQVLALQAGDVDVLVHFSPTGGKALLNDPNVTVIELRASVAPRDPHAQRQGAVRRQARAPGHGARGRPRRRSSTASWPASPTSATTARSRRCSRRPTRASPQRKQDIEKAKALHAAGRRHAALQVTIDTWDGFELPDLAQLLQNDAAKIGIKLKLERHARGHVLRRRGLRQVAVAGLDRWASPTTATAACRTCSSARRCRARAPGTRRTSRTRTYDSWSRTTSRRSTSRRSGGRGEDPEAAARRDAEHLRLLLLLPTATKKNVGRRAR